MYIPGRGWCGCRVCEKCVTEHICPKEEEPHQQPLTCASNPVERPVERPRRALEDWRHAHKLPISTTPPGRDRDVDSGRLELSVTDCGLQVSVSGLLTVSPPTCYSLPPGSPGGASHQPEH
eukprot:29849-Chlamydomonas_euryale.AAC.1